MFEVDIPRWERKGFFDYARGGNSIECRIARRFFEPYLTSDCFSIRFENDNYDETSWFNVGVGR